MFPLITFSVLGHFRDIQSMNIYNGTGYRASKDRLLESCIRPAIDRHNAMVERVLPALSINGDICRRITICADSDLNEAVSRICACGMHGVDGRRLWWLCINNALSQEVSR